MCQTFLSPCFMAVFGGMWQISDFLIFVYELILCGNCVGLFTCVFFVMWSFNLVSKFSLMECAQWFLCMQLRLHHLVGMLLMSGWHFIIFLSKIYVENLSLQNLNCRNCILNFDVRISNGGGCANVLWHIACWVLNLTL